MLSEFLYAVSTGVPGLRTVLFLAAWVAAWPPAAGAVESIKALALFRDKAVLEVDGMHRTLATGQVSAEGVKLLSATSREAVVEVDGRQHTLSLGEHISGSFAPRAAGTTVTIAPDGNGMYPVNGIINGFQVNFVVDTGATLVSMNRNDARRIGIDYRLQGEEARSSTASGLARVYLVELDSVRVGDIEQHNVRAAVHDGDFPEVILLGNSFLGGLHIERQGALLKLTQP